MKPRYFTKTFTHFFVGFLCILGLAFGVMLWAANVPNAPAPDPIDNIAVPQ